MTDTAGETPDVDAAVEFDTVAEWTAEAARALGPEHYIPAGCRGSGGPPALDWFLNRLAPGSASRMLDVGAGVGGPAGYARDRTGVRPVLAEPQPGACRAARELFGFHVVQADATALPFPAGAFDVLWSLGVIDTLADHEKFFAETTRCLAASGSIGLLAYVADRQVSAAVDTNDFPDDAELSALISRFGLTCVEQMALTDLGPAPADWTEREEAVSSEVERRHRDHPAWQQAAEQEQRIGRLIKTGQVRGRLLHLAPARPGGHW